MKKLTCAILTRDTNWFMDSVLSTKDISFYEVNPKQIGFELPNPYSFTYCDAPDIILVDSSFYSWVRGRYPNTIKQVYAALRNISKYKTIIGAEGTDWFHLARPTEAYNLTDITLKASGLFKDLDLYNYEVGSCSPNKIWTAKTKKLAEPFSQEIIDKLRLSLPCFITIDRRVRRKARFIKTQISAPQKFVRYWGDWVSDIEVSLLSKLIKPKKLLHFIGGLTHIQRLEMLIELKEYRAESTFQINDVEDYIWGTERRRQPMTAEIKEALIKRVSDEGFYSKTRMNRNTFKRSLLNHKIILAPTGFGELTYRHAEGWKSNRTVLCQDLSHVNTMYPLKNMQNVCFCKTDFSDIKDKVKELKNDNTLRNTLAQNGHTDWVNWISGYEIILDQGVSAHIRKHLNL